MDEFAVVVTPVKAKGDDSEDAPIPVNINDQGDGTYAVTYVPPKPGKYTVRGTVNVV
jgi:hypothetical protein